MPAYRNFIIDKGYDAAAALIKFRAVKLSAEETVVPLAASTDVALGVAQFDVTTAELAKGKGASVALEGLTEIEIAATVTVGQEVMFDTVGRATPATGAGNRVVGAVVHGAVGAGSRATIRLALPGRVL